MQVEQFLEDWGEVKDSPVFSPDSQPQPIATAQTQAIAPQAIQYLPMPTAPQQPEKPYWFRLAIVAIVSVSASGSLGFVAWLLTAPNRSAAAANEYLTAIAMTDKPSNVTINYAPQCNQGLIGGQACTFPEMPTAPTANQPVSVQGQNTSLMVNQGQSVRSIQELQSIPPDQLTLEELNRLKVSTPYETAIAHPQWWNGVLAAYNQKGGK